ncbi:FecR domain-containing protein [Pedobacter sp. MC2016-15]|uniref:FecR family protein n=1 Tax=Pedobacter sp. MC2016-15 TaxID=2994473 RepID=UPI002245A63A|nr:FecR family protein [Pedobacter sp. MC2016-15]MCX2478227.1 FecR domain-containing protein [Pedobacter sp. MC2016-15]
MSEKQRSSTELKKMLRKFNSKDLKPQEYKAINAWYDALDQDMAEANPHRELKAKLRITQVILEEPLATPSDESSKHWFLNPGLKYAATLVLIGIAAYFSLKPSSLKKSSGYKLLVSTGDTRKNVRLSDGSVIMLNSGSSLSIAEDFNLRDRRIKITGEGFFKIAKDTTRPFIIRSEDLNTTVLGTSFNISSYPDLEELKIAVSSGKVRVASIREGEKETLLSAGMVKNQVLIYNNKSKAMEIKTGEASLYNSWTNNELYIDNASVEDIAHLLSRYYHIKTNIEPGLGRSDRYTIKLGDESIDAATQILSQLTKYRFSHQQNQIYIMKNN